MTPANARNFKKHVDEIDGVLVCLPNFGDEKGVSTRPSLAAPTSPCSFKATPMTRTSHSHAVADLFCGKISVCNNLAGWHQVHTHQQTRFQIPSSDSFKRDL